MDITTIKKYLLENNFKISDNDRSRVIFNGTEYFCFYFRFTSISSKNGKQEKIHFVSKGSYIEIIYKELDIENIISNLLSIFTQEEDICLRCHKGINLFSNAEPRRRIEIVKKQDYLSAIKCFPKMNILYDYHKINENIVSATCGYNAVIYFDNIGCLKEVAVKHLWNEGKTIEEIKNILCCNLTDDELLRYII